MPNCFVIQPFDAGKFDKRFADTYAPAIKDAGLDPYRVDQDPSATVPIEAIEQGIRTAAMCSADISTDNPNVWFELGYAIALGKNVVMVCSSERVTRFPFDVQHRSIITYKSEAASDFEDLKRKITGKIRALSTKEESLKAIANSEVAPIHGLSQQEMIVITCVAGNLDTPQGHISANYLRKEVESQGFTKMAAMLGIKSLTMKGFMDYSSYESNFDDEGYIGYTLTEKGWEWILANQDKFLIQKRKDRVDEF